MASQLPLQPPFCDQPPAPWWDTQADVSLLVGTYKHGYERYAVQRLDPTLCFVARSVLHPNPPPPLRVLNLGVVTPLRGPNLGVVTPLRVPNLGVVTPFEETRAERARPHSRQQQRAVTCRGSRPRTTLGTLE